MNGAWRIEMTEVEHGWGPRPDGYLYSLTKEAVEARAKQLTETKWKGVTILAGRAEFIPISAELHLDLMETVCISTAVGKKKGDLTIVG
jgi:hypothetical protein